MRTTRKFATLTRNWTYTNFVGEKITWKKGRRFMLNRFCYFENDGNLRIENWYGYGADAVIEAKYFAKV